MLSRFLKEYGGIEFTTVKFRPGQAFTTGFGYDNTFNAFRLHNAIDRGNKGKGNNPIYAPFNCYASWMPNYSPAFGTLLVLRSPEWGFEVRIAHMEDIEEALKHSVAIKRQIRAGALLGQAGNAGMSTGIHTHTEVVSSRNTNELLDEIITEKYGTEIEKLSAEGAADYIKQKRLVEDLSNPKAAWDREVTKRGIVTMTPYSCLRKDYMDNQLKTFYNSQALFGM